MPKDTDKTPSELTKIPIAFEYDVSWHDARKAIRIRTHKE